MTVKRTQVVMLPTNEKAVRILLINPSTGKMEIPKHEYNYSAGEYQKVGYNTFHLYFLSDEEIKEGDWFLSLDFDIIGQLEKGEKVTTENVKKIIATTDTSLKLPQPSQDFIEVFVREYNKGNVIEWIDVEYEEDFKTFKGIKLKTCFNEVTRGKDTFSAYDFNDKLVAKNQPKELLVENFKLKTNYKNEITIRKIKDSWSREEVINLLKFFVEDTRGDKHWVDADDEWIENNL